MQPDVNKITINGNLKKVENLLYELVLNPRLLAIKWAQVTKQTPNIKIGYPGQHLASLITGMEGERSGARGNDLTDGSEVKSCSRIDQLDKCMKCGAAVARIEKTCSACESGEIIRNNDSKWLFTIRSKSDLDTLLHSVGRVVLVLGDYPNFDKDDFDTLRFQAFEIWPSHTRNRRFCEIMSNYYEKIYLEHKKKDSNITPAPKNFWPDQYQFYLCNPIRTFLCEVTKANTMPQLIIQEYIRPDTNREHLQSISMPKDILQGKELALLITKATTEELCSSLPPNIHLARNPDRSDIMNHITNINETLRQYLDLRDTDKIATAKNKYARKSH